MQNGRVSPQVGKDLWNIRCTTDGQNQIFGAAAAFSAACIRRHDVQQLNRATASLNWRNGLNALVIGADVLHLLRRPCEVVVELMAAREKGLAVHEPLNPALGWR